MSSDAVELKKLVKQLQSASTNEVRVIALCRPLRTHFPPFQDIVSILRILKKDFRVNEAVLRVGVAHRFFYFQ